MEGNPGNGFPSNGRFAPCLLSKEHFAMNSRRDIEICARNEARAGCPTPPCDQGGDSPLDLSTSGSPWQAGCPTIRKMNIFKSNFPIFDLVYGAILIYMAISCLISIMISHFKFLKIIVGQPAWRGEGPPETGHRHGYGRVSLRRCNNSGPEKRIRSKKRQPALAINQEKGNSRRQSKMEGK